MRRLIVNTVLIVALAVTAATGSATGQSAPAPAGLESITSALRFRNIGPFRTSAWVTEIAVPETPLRDATAAIAPRLLALRRHLYSQQS